MTEELKLNIFIGSNNTFAYLNMFDDEQLREAAMLLWEDGCLDFGDKRGFYEVSFGVESGFEAPCSDYDFALFFNEFKKVDQ